MNPTAHTRPCCVPTPQPGPQVASTADGRVGGRGALGADGAAVLIHAFALHGDGQRSHVVAVRSAPHVRACWRSWRGW
jgi:hypothetical protein